MFQRGNSAVGRTLFSAKISLNFSRCFFSWSHISWRKQNKNKHWPIMSHTRQDLYRLSRFTLCQMYYLSAYKKGQIKSYEWNFIFLLYSNSSLRSSLDSCTRKASGSSHIGRSVLCAANMIPGYRTIFWNGMWSHLWCLSQIWWTLSPVDRLVSYFKTMCHTLSIPG